MDGQPPVVPPGQGEPPKGSEGNGFSVFCTEYTNRWGKRMVAADYGYTAWHLRFRGRRKTKS